MNRVLSLTVAVLGIATLAAAAQQPAAGVGSPIAGVPTPAVTAPAPARAAGARVISGTNANVFTTIQGNALDSTNGVLPNTVVRLRDARAGRIVGTQSTDKSGLFAFRGVEPGSYVVEIMGNDQSILAASQLLNVNAGDAVSAIVKLPFRIPPFAGILGHSTPSAIVVATAAAASGVLASQATTSEASPRK
jgi:hypothetical protein